MGLQGKFLEKRGKGVIMRKITEIQGQFKAFLSTNPSQAVRLLDGSSSEDPFKGNEHMEASRMRDFPGKCIS